MTGQTIKVEQVDKRRAADYHRKVGSPEPTVAFILGEHSDLDTLLQTLAEHRLDACRGNGLDDLARELLAILADIQSAAHMAWVLSGDPDEAAAWLMIREKAASGAVAYREHRFPTATEKQAD